MISAMNVIALQKKAEDVPHQATNNPARKGPTKRDPWKTDRSSAMAVAISSFFTSSGTRALMAGISNAMQVPSTAESTMTCQI
jgi:hypothetical protein